MRKAGWQECLTMLWLDTHIDALGWMLGEEGKEE